jgi:hypothetical protein
MVKGKLETQDTMDRWGDEVWVEGLALMDRGIGEWQAKGSRHDGDHHGGEVWVESLAPMDQGNGKRASKAKVDGLEVLCGLSDPHHLWRSSQRYIDLIKWLGEYVGNVFPCGHQLREIG